MDTPEASCPAKFPYKQVPTVFPILLPVRARARARARVRARVRARARARVRVRVRVRARVKVGLGLATNRISWDQPHASSSSSSQKKLIGGKWVPVDPGPLP
jgi:hypothetical protein